MSEVCCNIFHLLCNEINRTLVILQEFWDWSWQELALYDLAEMIDYIHSVTNSKLFVVGHSQVLMVVVHLPLHLLFFAFYDMHSIYFSSFSGDNYIFGCLHSARDSGKG